MEGIRPRIQQFNITVEHEFSGSNILSVAYVGSRSIVWIVMRTLTRFHSMPGSRMLRRSAGTPGCDAAGNCDVQDILINARRSSAFFVPFRGYTVMQWVHKQRFGELQLVAGELSAQSEAWADVPGGLYLVALH